MFALYSRWIFFWIILSRRIRRRRFSNKMFISLILGKDVHFIYDNCKITVSQIFFTEFLGSSSLLCTQLVYFPESDRQNREQLEKRKSRRVVSLRSAASHISMIPGYFERSERSGSIWGECVYERCVKRFVSSNNTSALAPSISGSVLMRRVARYNFIRPDSRVRRSWNAIWIGESSR